MLLYGKILRGLSFVQNLPPESNPCYLGKTTPDETELPVFWYRPEGSEGYRVIYGDLSVVGGVPRELLR